MRLYGIRGATTVLENTQEAILKATTELLESLIAQNQLEQDNVVSIFFTTTPDLDADFPAKACRKMGWDQVALLGAVEANVPHGLPFCIRILIHAYTKTERIKHVYLKEAVKLRPDLS